MKGYKAFEKGLICRGKQYAENTVFEEERAEICRKGMHFCENPFDVLDYYNLVNDDGTFNDFAEVEALDDVKTDDNKKFCTTKLKIGAKLSFGNFVNACVDFVLEKTKHKKGEYGHVLLTEEQEKKLNEEYGVFLTLDAITFLDEYIEMKGYKAKNHYLAIKKWVIDAVKEREPKHQGTFDTDDFFERAAKKALTALESEDIKKKAEALKSRLG